MTVNIYGPHGAGVGETTNRPSPTVSGNSLYTWFRDCIGGIAGTGTKIPAVWLNFIAANFREAVVGRNVAPDEDDDQLLLKAINSADRAHVNIGDAGVGIYAGLNGGGQHQHYKVRGLGSVSVALDGPTNEVRITGAGGGGSGRGVLVGLITSPAAARQVGIAVGSCWSHDGTEVIDAASPLTIDLSTTGANGLDTGALGANIWYHVFVIKNVGSGAVAGLAAAALSPVLPSGYTKRLRIGSIKTDGSSNIIDYLQVFDEFIWRQPIADQIVSSPSFPTVGSLVTLSVPPGLRVKARMTIDGYAGYPDAFFELVTPDQAAIGFNPPSQPLDAFKRFQAYGRSTALSTGLLDMWTNSSAQLMIWIWNSTSWTFTNGWIDPRGRE